MGGGEARGCVIWRNDGHDGHDSIDSEALERRQHPLGWSLGDSSLSVAYSIVATF